MSKVSRWLWAQQAARSVDATRIFQRGTTARSSAPSRCTPAGARSSGCCTMPSRSATVSGSSDRARALVAERQRRGQARQGPTRLQRHRPRYAIADITPAILRQHSEPERLADPPQRRKESLEALRLSRYQLERWHIRHLDEIVGGEGVGKDLERKRTFHRGLQAKPGRALATVAEPHRDGVALAQKAVGDPHQQRADPRPDVVAVGFQHQFDAVASLSRREVWRLRIGELRAARVGGGAPTDLYGAGVVDTERAGGIGDDDFLQRARHYRLGWRDRRRSDGPALIDRKRHIRSTRCLPPDPRSAPDRR